MKKIIVAAIIASMIPVTVLADHHHEEHHRSGGFNPWPFVAGAVVGGIIVNEATRDRDPRPPQRYITVCEDIMLYDSTGRYIKTERHCRQELVSEY